MCGIFFLIHTIEKHFGFPRTFQSSDLWLMLMQFIIYTSNESFFLSFFLFWSFIAYRSHICRFVFKILVILTSDKIKPKPVPAVQLEGTMGGVCLQSSLNQVNLGSNLVHQSSNTVSVGSLECSY